MPRSLLTFVLLTLTGMALFALGRWQSDAAAPSSSPTPPYTYPLVKDHGGVVVVAGAAEPPKRGMKVVFDITAGGPADKVNQGLERVARCLNLYAAQGLQPSDVAIVAVLHGNATLATLNAEAFARQNGGKENPNLPLIRELRKHGVELFVCGQAVAYKGLKATDIAPELPLAVSAMTLIINRQADGYAYLPIH
jgi:intracellular sulfur oxidation DsrE/DsrF family protein